MRVLYSLLPYRSWLCTELCEMGVQASEAEPGRPEEQTGTGSLGIIDIANSPIGWINMRIVGVGSDSDDFVDYGIPDSRELPRVELYSSFSRIKKLLGRKVVIRWKGEDGNTGIRNQLANDSYIVDAIIRTCPVTIKSCPDYGCWLIVQQYYTWHSPLIKDYQWRCYERIAEIVLESPIQR